MIPEKTRLFLPLLLLLLAGSVTSQGEQAEAKSPEKKMPLWGEASLSQWEFVLIHPTVDTASVWSIENGVVRCEGKPLGYMRTKKSFKDYALHLEWRWTEKPGNSGVLLHSRGATVCSKASLFPECVEAQLKSGNAGDVVVMYGARVAEMSGDYREGTPFLSIPKREPSSEKTLQEWNAYEILCMEDTVILRVNGVVQNIVTGATPTEGSICLQSEGGVVEFRNAHLRPLTKKDKRLRRQLMAGQ